MDPKPLSKAIYEKAVSLRIKFIKLHFSGGDDEGYLNVETVPYNSELNREVEDWAWYVYHYNGAGDGNAYGDDIVYDIVNKTVKTGEWITSRLDLESKTTNLEVADEEI